MRKMYGSVSKQGVLIIRTNLAPKELYKTPDSVAAIKRRRLEGLGYVIRMDQTNVGKKIF
jgi:hypothetical protein